MSNALASGVGSAAIFSDDRVFRYALYRQISEPEGGLQHNHRTVNFIGLNPSTADEERNDPTVRRCIGFARDWNYSRLVVTNIYAFRATDPIDLFEALDHNGPENDQWLKLEAQAANLVIAAWSGMDLNRGREVCDLLRDIPLFCLGRTKLGAPRHPLYMPGTTQPARFA